MTEAGTPSGDPLPRRLVTLPRLFLALTLVIALAAASCGGDDDDAGGSSGAGAEVDDDDAGGSSGADAEVDDDGLLAAVVTFDGLGTAHERGDLEYPMFPPVGGTHSPEWQTCGVYTVPVAEERAVHSLEHGAVWIAHGPDVDVSALVAIVEADEHLLMTPVDGLDAPIVLSAWGAQLEVSSVDAPEIAAFIDTYVRQGPEAAPCVLGGVGAPPDQPGPAA